MRLYVPLDGTPEAERALGPATFVLRHSAPPHECVLGRIYRDPLSIPDAFADLSAVHPHFVREVCTDRLAYLQAIARRPVWNDIAVNCKVGLGEPAHMICEQARLAQADMVVMTTHSRTGFEYTMLGSYAEEIVHESHLPTLLIRSEGEVFPDPASNPTPRILVPLDGSSWAAEVLEPACRLAEVLRATFCLVQVLPEEAREDATEQVNAANEALQTYVTDIQCTART